MIPRSVWVAGASVLLLGSIAVAQTVYTWRDSNGVVHFSDENPEGVKNVEKLTLEAPVPLVSSGGEGEAPSGEQGESGGTMVVTPGAPGQQEEAKSAPVGPAEVVFLGADLEAVGATQRRVRGKVRNVGGTQASRVAVRVVIADANSGSLCITTEIGADPRSLGPGEIATFEGDLDTPCFYANPNIGYYPEWD